MPSFPKFRLGFLINPLAGLGGSVALKGTDGLAKDAFAKGAEPKAQERARACVLLLAPHSEGFSFFAPKGEMGGRVLKELSIDFQEIYATPFETAAKDTKCSCKEFLKEGIDLLLFCGGDGTARDIASIIGSKIPILGIPAGVKMHSGVFAISPEAAAELVLRYKNNELMLRDTEIVDVDEDLYRSGMLQTILYCNSRTPYLPALVQERKAIYTIRSEEEYKEQIALFASEFMRDGSAYIIGAGTTTSKIAEIQGLEKTLLGVDVIMNGDLILKDASEKDLLSLLSMIPKAKIIVSPIGAQGFVFGRGNQQLSPTVIRRVGLNNLIIVSTPHKLSEIPYLLTYTGDKELDGMLEGKIRVITGYRMAQLKDLKAASEIY